MANQIRLKLQSAGYGLFVSGKEIATCDRFLFLASPASLAEDCYTQTELALAEERWPDPI